MADPNSRTTLDFDKWSQDIERINKQMTNPKLAKSSKDLSAAAKGAAQEFGTLSKNVERTKHNMEALRKARVVELMRDYKKESQEVAKAQRALAVAKSEEAIIKWSRAIQQSTDRMKDMEHEAAKLNGEMSKVSAMRNMVNSTLGQWVAGLSAGALAMKTMQTQSNLATWALNDMLARGEDLPKTLGGGMWHTISASMTDYSKVLVGLGKTSMTTGQSFDEVSASAKRLSGALHLDIRSGELNEAVQSASVLARVMGTDLSTQTEMFVQRQRDLGETSKETAEGMAQLYKSIQYTKTHIKDSGLEFNLMNEKLREIGENAQSSSQNLVLMGNMMKNQIAYAKQLGATTKEAYESGSKMREVLQKPAEHVKQLAGEKLMSKFKDASEADIDKMLSDVTDPGKREILKKRIKAALKEDPAIAQSLLSNIVGEQQVGLQAKLDIAKEMYESAGGGKSGRAAALVGMGMDIKDPEAVFMMQNWAEKGFKAETLGAGAPGEAGAGGAMADLSDKLGKSQAGNIGGMMSGATEMAANNPWWTGAGAVGLMMLNKKTRGMLGAGLAMGGKGLSKIGGWAGGLFQGGAAAGAGVMAKGTAPVAEAAMKSGGLMAKMAKGLRASRAIPLLGTLVSLGFAAKDAATIAGDYLSGEGVKPSDLLDLGADAIGLIPGVGTVGVLGAQGISMAAGGTVDEKIGRIGAKTPGSAVAGTPGAVSNIPTLSANIKGVSAGGDFTFVIPGFDQQIAMAMGRINQKTY